MKCKHCGKELVAVTMYMEQPSFAANAAVPAWQPNAGWVSLPTDGSPIYFHGAAAAAGGATQFVTYCAHEPAVEPIDTTSGT